MQQGVLLAPQTVKRFAWSLSDLCSYFNIKAGDTATLHNMINYGFYRNDSCTGYYQINAPLSFNKTEAELQAIFNREGDIARARLLINYLYTTVPELYIDTGLRANFDYTITLSNAVQLINDYKAATHVALCGQYAELFRAIWQLYDSAANKPVLKVASMSISEGYWLNHTVCLLYSYNGGQPVVIDVMYGYLYQPGSGRLEYADMQVLRHKRFLTNKIWPCNFLADSLAQYYLTPPKALTNYELHERERIELLNPNGFDESRFMHDLDRLLRENAFN